MEHTKCFARYLTLRAKEMLTITITIIVIILEFSKCFPDFILPPGINGAQCLWRTLSMCIFLANPILSPLTNSFIQGGKIHKSSDHLRWRLFFLSIMLYKQHMDDIFEVYDVFTVNTKEPQILTICLFKVPWICFPKTHKIFMLLYFHHPNQ